MKKILLVENVKIRLDKYKTIFESNYSDVVLIVDQVPQNPKNHYYLLDDFAALILHKNYYERNDELPATSKVIEAANKIALPFVIFSGDSAGSPSDVIFHNDLYRNLFYFLNNYRITNNIEFNILRYGKLYKDEEILKLKEIILKDFFNKNYSERLQFTPNQKTHLRVLLSKLNFNEEDITKSFKRLSDSDHYKSITDFIERLNYLIEKYTKGKYDNYSL